MNRLIGILGILAILGLAYVISNDRNKIDKKLIFWGISLQLFFALLILKVPGGKFVFNSIDIFIKKILDFSVEGSKFLFGNLADDSFKNKPHVIMVVGVNGVGKTTTIGKLANKYKKLGLSVIIGAADTFRAAAIDQLVTWADRVDVPIVKQNMGSDPASVAFDTLNYAKNKNADIVLIDTAGRLHNKVNLMNELSKIKRVMDKVIDNAPQM